MPSRGAISFCIHQHFADHFLRQNVQAIEALHARIGCEVVIAGDEAKSDFRLAAPVHTATIPDAGYNQARSAAVRNASSDLCMWCDASDHLQLDAILDAEKFLKRHLQSAAVVGGMSAAEQGFTDIVSPAGILMRREGAIRFVRVHEYGLIGNFETIAQLQNAGKIEFRQESLSLKKRIRTPTEWRFTVRNAFFHPNRYERYVGEFQLYDLITLERHLADAEHFVLFWKPIIAPDERIARMLGKRARLYLEAGLQAVADSEASIALHYLTRALTAAVPANVSLIERMPSNIDELVSGAVSEQIAYLADLKTADRIVIEDQLETRALTAGLSTWTDKIVWHQRNQLQDLITGSDFIVFAKAKDCVEFNARQDGPKLATSLESLQYWIAAPLKALMQDDKRHN